MRNIKSWKEALNESEETDDKIEIRTLLRWSGIGQVSFGFFLRVMSASSIISINGETGIPNKGSYVKNHWILFGAHGRKNYFASVTNNETVGVEDATGAFVVNSALPTMNFGNHEQGVFTISGDYALPYDEILGFFGALGVRPPNSIVNAIKRGAKSKRLFGI